MSSNLLELCGISVWHRLYSII